MKKCSKCKIDKDESEFHKKVSASDGLDSHCKECKKEKSKQYLEENKDKINERSKEYYNNNKDKVSEKHKEYYNNNRNKVKEYYKEYYLENKDKAKEYYKEYYLENRDKMLEHQKQYNKKYKEEKSEYNKEYYKNNRDKVNEYQKEYKKEKYKTDMNYALKCRLRRRLLLALKRNNKSGKTLQLLGCSIEFFKEYLESHFYRNEKTGEPMSWDNRCRWHLDHILPCASFDLTDPEQQKICMHYTNLQPLFAEQNLKKSDKLDFDLFTRPTPQCFEKIYEEK